MASIATFDLKSDVNVFLAISLPLEQWFLFYTTVSILGSTIVLAIEVLHVLLQRPPKERIT